MRGSYFVLAAVAAAKAVLSFRLRPMPAETAASSSANTYLGWNSEA